MNLKTVLNGVSKLDLEIEEARLAAETRKNSELRLKLDRLKAELALRPPYTRDAGGAPACVEFEVDPEIVLDNPDYALDYVETLTRRATLELLLKQRG